jgi:amino acid permease
LLIGALLLNIAGNSVSNLLHQQSQWRYFTLGIGGLLIPTALINSMKQLSVVSSIGLISFLAFIILLVTKCVTDITKAGDIHPHVKTHLFGNLDILEYLKSFARCYFASATMTGVTSVIKEMKKQSSFPKVTVIANILVYFLYMIICLSCYLAWGNSVKGSILEVVNKMGEGQKDKSWLSSNFAFMSDCLMLVTVLANFTALLAPLSANSEKMTRRIGIELPSFLVRVLLLVVTSLIGIISSKINVLVGLLGGVTLVILGIFIPVGLSVQAMRYRGHAANVLDILFMILITLLGAVVAVNTIINS